MAENNYKTDNDGIVSQEFTPTDQKLKGVDLLRKDANDVRAKAAKLVHGLFSRATNNKNVQDLGRDDSRKEGEPVYSTDMGIIETGLSKPAIPEKPSFEPVTADHVKYEEMADAIKNGPTSANEERERQVVVDQEAKARAVQEAEAANQLVPGDPTEYNTYQQNRDELQLNAFNPTSWMEREKSDTENRMNGGAEKNATDKFNSGESDGDTLRKDLYKTGNYDSLEDVENAAKKIEEQHEADKRNQRPIFNDDSTPEPRIEFSDGNPSVIEAENDVAGHLNLNNIRHQADETSRIQSGDSWIDAHRDNASSVRLENSDRNQSVIEAEDDVSGHLKMNEINRKLDQADAERAQADREKSGKGWIKAHGDYENQERLEQSDQNPSVLAAENEVTGQFGENARRIIADDFSRGVDEQVDRFEQPIEPGDITIRRPDQVDRDTADPTVSEQRDRVRQRTLGISPIWRRRLAMVGLASLMLFAKDRGPANPVVEYGVPPVNEAPYVPMPELAKKPSQLDLLPKTKAHFPTIGPAGENISQGKADFGGWFDAEWVKQYKAEHAEEYAEKNFNMRNADDINLLNRLKSNDKFSQAKDMYLDYLANNEIRAGDMKNKVEIKRKENGSIDKVIIDVPSSSGYEVPDFKEFYNLMNNSKP